MISGVNYAAQQHAEKKVPSVAKYVHVCACERENKNMSLFYSISLRFGVDRGLLDALEAAYNEVSFLFLETSLEMQMCIVIAFVRVLNSFNS